MAQVSILGAGPAVVVARDTELREVASVVVDGQARMSLSRGLYVLEVSFPDGRFQRMTLQIGDAAATVELPTKPAEVPQPVPRIETKIRPPVVAQPLSQPRPRRIRRSKGLRPDRLVTVAGQHVNADVDVGTYLDQLSESSFTGHIDVFHEDNAGRFKFNRGELKGIDLRDVEHESPRFSAVVEALTQRLVVETQVSVRRKGYYVTSWSWEDMRWQQRRVKKQPDGLAASSHGKLELLQVITPERSEFVAFAPGLPEASLSTDEEGRAALRFHRSAQALLDFVYQGDRQAAAKLSTDFIRNKYENAPLAAVGGYYLLSTGTERSVRDDWWKNLAGIEWLPDGAILAGWHALRQDEPREALPLFLGAARRGLPLFTRGLQLLLEGLWTFSDDQAANAAAERLRPYADSARRSAAVTTFGGASPDRPTRLESPIAPPPSAQAVAKARLREGLSIRVIS